MNIYETRNLLNQGKNIYDLNLKVTFYARVSTDKTEQENSLSNQIEHYTSLIKNQNNWTYINGYIDEGLSGKSVAKRENFLQMIEDAKNHKFDLILTKEISRFSRNTIDSLSYTRELLNYGVGVFFQNDNINTLFADSELRLTIMSSIAQDELRKLSERTKFGYKTSIKKGRVLGNNNIYGYDKNDCKLVINEQEAIIVKTIFEKYNEGLGIRRLIQYLNNNQMFNRDGKPFYSKTIGYIITNPKYKGYYCGNKVSKIDYMSNKRQMLDEAEWIMYKDNESVPPIVSEELWDKCNATFQKRSKIVKSNSPQGFQNKYSYSGKIFCKEHNATYWRTEYKYPSGNKEVWNCRVSRRTNRDACQSSTLYTDELNLIIKKQLEYFTQNKFQKIDSYLEQLEMLNKKNTISKDISLLENQIQKINQKKDKLFDLVSENLISKDEFKNKNNEFNLILDELYKKIEDYKNLKNQNIDIKEIISKLNNFLLNRLDLNNVSQLVEKIEIGEERVIDNTRYINMDITYIFGEKVSTIHKKDLSLCTTIHMNNYERKYEFERSINNLTGLKYYVQFNVQSHIRIA